MIPSTRANAHLFGARARGRALVAGDRRLFLTLLGLLLLVWSAMAVAIGPGAERLARTGATTETNRALVTCENAETRRAGELLRCRVETPETIQHRIEI